MSDVIPTGTTPDSDYLFARMTEVTLDLCRPDSGRSVLDVASGVGQDSLALAARGARVVGAEPSKRMMGMARLFAADAPSPQPGWVRSWSDALPFAGQSFDAAVCKGAIDHFDCPAEAVAEMARVTRGDGVVVLAIANFDSLACRLGRFLDGLDDWLPGRQSARGRRGYDAPSDHFTRYDLSLMREQASRYFELDAVVGVSLGWGAPGWSKLASRLPRGVANAILRALDALARRYPALADVVVLAGPPRRSVSTSS